MKPEIINNMNIYEYDILNELIDNSLTNQRVLSLKCGCSLGNVNKSLKVLVSNGFLNDKYHISLQAKELIKLRSPKNAIILAAGFGMRMVPINTEFSKGMIEVNGVPLIERIITQLHEANIRSIYVVVGYMKEQYEYLIDKFGVELVVNNEYSEKNNLHSLALVANKINNTYVIPCDILCYKNPFSKHELYSWYMVSDSTDDDSNVRVSRNRELVKTKNPGNKMIGIAYFTRPESDYIKKKLIQFDNDKNYKHAFWEETLYEHNQILVPAKLIQAKDIVEINTYEQLREVDDNSSQLSSTVILTIADVFNTSLNNITRIQILKKGMTNRSFLFVCHGKKYIMRVPGEGTDQLIDRKQEADIYRAISGKNICDDPVYINPQNGFKITKYINNARPCNPFKKDDLKKCMKKLKQFHQLKLTVNYQFNLFSKIQFYESLWQGNSSIFKDYHETKENVFKLKEYIDKHAEEYALTHIDAVPDNFLFSNNEGKENIQLIDWEYSAMQDQDVDLAMFSIYSMYNRCQIDQLIDIYFEDKCPIERRIKIYCYVATTGLLWSNWCEYKRQLGVEFGEYSIAQYHYAKEYYKIVTKELSLIGDSL